PFATSQTLTALANQLIDYPAQPYVDAGDYYDVLRGYAVTQRKNGRPYVAEAHHPDEDRWIYDGFNHSEDYNHSTFNDLVLSGLLGIRPQAGGSVRIAPLAPPSWDHWAVENVAYHGRNLSVVWDSTGSAYGRGAGLSVWLDGRLAHRQATPARTTVPVPPSARAELPELVDDAANVDEAGYPVARASYTWGGDTAANAIDGQDFHLDVPTTRWTTWSSPNRADWLEVDLGAATVVSDVRIDFYDDGGGVRAPQSFGLQYQTPEGEWRDVPGQTRTPATPVGRAINRVLVDPPLTTDRLRVLPVRDDGGAVGITAVQVWRRPDPALAVSFPGLSGGGAVDADAGETVTVRSRVTATRAARDVRVSLQVPRGWTARAVTAAQASRLGKGDTLGTTWRVTIPPGTALSDGPPIRALATSRAAAGVSSAVVPTKWSFDPADFPTPAWQDDFSTDRLASYRVDQLIGNEPPPELSVADGALTARASSRAFGVLAAPVTGSPSGTAVIVTPRSFGGGDPEDSLFAGASRAPSDNALIWYNNHFGTSGADVRVDNRSRPEATGGCCADYRWQAGDRLAAVTKDGNLTTWLFRDDKWTQLHDAPLSAAVDDATVGSWNPAFGLRLDAGAIVLDDVTVLTR
ncbi:discoidin domain-containing protein, partial [Actinoplanes sp. NPDC051633]|uniref:discoidin domain-containing protein n=1 Tax=Actinoplanes sp. NPDC051633 TaxID=3155670 RepID=UPI00343CCC8C